MAGSITWRAYTADDGNTYSVRIDESNANGALSGGTGVLMPVRTDNFSPIPKGLKMRYALGRSLDGKIRRKFYIGTAVNARQAVTAGATITASGYPGEGDTPGTSTVFVITAYRGEKRALVPSFTALDTGLTDGTASQ